MTPPVKRYAAQVEAATAEDLRDAANMLRRLNVPMRDRALLELSAAVVLLAWSAKHKADAGATGGPSREEFERSG